VAEVEFLDPLTQLQQTRGDPPQQDASNTGSQTMANESFLPETGPSALAQSTTQAIA
jgi:hypothetical protein